jgi:hypothetical protein
MRTQPEISAEASSVDDFVADEVESDDLRGIVLVEVTANRVADLRVQIGRVVGFGEDRFTQGARGEALPRGLPRRGGSLPASYGFRLMGSSCG